MINAVRLTGNILKEIVSKFKKNSKPQIIEPKVDITIVDFKDASKPVLYDGLVYQSCFIDFDGDLVLKDDIHGVKVFPIGLGEDEFYNLSVLKTLEDHPVNLLKQIAKDGEIVEGETLHLQRILNKHYEQSSRVRSS